MISQFTHPGISISSSTLAQISSENNAYRINGYNEVLNTINNHIPFPSSFDDISIVYVRTLPFDTTPTEHRMQNDAVLAYANALKWAREEDPNDASKAIQILNGWAEHFAGMEACSQNHAPEETGCCYKNGAPATCSSNPPNLQKSLQASWAAPTFAAAAEIIRHYKLNGTTGAGWSSGKISNFENFLLKLNDYVDDIVNSVNSAGPDCTPNCTGWAGNNGGASAAYAQMAIGVFTDSSSIYQNGRDAIINVLIENIIDYPSGEVNELAAKGCKGPQMSLTALTYAADIHRLQGSFEIYDAHSKRLRDGWKGMGKAFDPNVFFVRDCSNERIMQGVEKIFNYWINHPELETLRNRQAPYGDIPRTFYGFTTYTDYCTNTIYPCN